MYGRVSGCDLIALASVVKDTVGTASALVKKCASTGGRLVGGKKKGNIMTRLNMIVLSLAIILGCAGETFAEGKPLKIYILVGQSNMQGHATPSTFPNMAADPASRDLHGKFVDENGNPRVYEQVRVVALCRGGLHGPLTVGFGANNGKLGPELGFGVTMYERIKEPVLIIKEAWGGKSLNKDFRSPGAGAYALSEKQKKNWSKERIKKHSEATGHYYRLMVEHVKQVLADPGKYHPAYNKDAGYELAGFVWFQGWNDMIDGETYPDRGKPGSYDLYSTLLAHFIRDVRKEFNVPKMPFVIGVMGVDGFDDGKKAFREAMAAPASMAEFKGNVFAVETAPFWDKSLDEVSARMWRVKNRRADKENKYTALREKVRPLIHAESEARKLAGPERGKKQAEIKAELNSIVYTPEELQLLKTSVSNGAYHYLGSAKILGRIGEAFANALVK